MQKREISGGFSIFNQIKYFFIFLFFGFLFLKPATGNAQLIDPESSSIEKSGDVILLALPAATGLTTLILEDRQGTWQFAKSFALNAAVTTALKYGVNKRRPFNSGGQAFPSGHTSITFQSAAFIHRRYGFKYSIPGYLLAGFTGYSRIHATRHDGYDVLAGAVVGIGSSFLFTTPYEREHMELSFSSSDDLYLLGFTYKF
ncbi:phosphatase PAP2 family protein [Salinimicrobium sp. GXAS 041]|uniref:phosphatase PAP2 family protein n=1 Tax=Salinimicrobium sp. GXAS 041 TaxID=3400806 RepID=UPI003C74FA55